MNIKYIVLMVVCSAFITGCSNKQNNTIQSPDSNVKEITNEVVEVDVGINRFVLTEQDFGGESIMFISFDRHQAERDSAEIELAMRRKKVTFDFWIDPEDPELALVDNSTRLAVSNQMYDDVKFTSQNILWQTELEEDDIKPGLVFLVKKLNSGKIYKARIESMTSRSVEIIYNLLSENNI